MTSPPTSPFADNAGPASDSGSSRCVLLIDLDNCPAELPTTPQDFSCFHRVIACHGVIEPRVALSTAERLAAPIAEGRLQILRMKRAGRNAADFGLAFSAGRLIESEPDSSKFVILSKDADLDHVVELIQALGRSARRVASLEAARSESSPAASAAVAAASVTTAPVTPVSVAPAAAALAAVASAAVAPTRVGLDASRMVSTANVASGPKPSATKPAAKSYSTRPDLEIAEITVDYARHLGLFPQSRPVRRKTLLRSIANYCRLRDQAILRRVVDELEASGYLRFDAKGQIEYLEQAFFRKPHRDELDPELDPERVPLGDAYETYVGRELNADLFIFAEEATPEDGCPPELPQHEGQHHASLPAKSLPDEMNSSRTGVASTNLASMESASVESASVESASSERSSVERLSVESASSERSSGESASGESTSGDETAHVEKRQRARTRKRTKGVAKRVNPPEVPDPFLSTELQSEETPEPPDLFAFLSAFDDRNPL